MAEKQNQNSNACCSAIEPRHNVETVPGESEHRMYAKAESVTYRPALDLYDLGDRYELRLDMPGTSPEHVDVTVNEGVLTIEAHVPSRYPDGITPLHAEFGVGDFRRQVRLGEDIDSEALSATYADGVLTLALPKRAEHRPRRIQVRGG